MFLLSPANCSGERAQLLVRPAASFALARELQSGGARLGEVFQFMSGLYFRGKLAYAARFARPAAGVPPALVITAGAGLLSVEHRIGPGDVRAFAAVPIEPADRRYRAPLERDAAELSRALGPRAEVILLGSIATGKYTDILLQIFGDQLRFPSAFVGRGDMSRGGLMLRAARAGLELEYVPVRGAKVHAEGAPLTPVARFFSERA
jgi:hypothetical protein